MEVNFFAAAELIRLAIPHLTKGEKPAIVNVGSICSRRGIPSFPEHSASKFALCGLTEALRGEMVRFGIDVLLVLPGPTRTDPSRHLLRQAGRMNMTFNQMMPPEEAAAEIVRRSGEESLGDPHRLADTLAAPLQSFLPSPDGLADRPQSTPAVPK